MNILGNHTPFVFVNDSDIFHNKSVRLVVGGGLFLALVCGFLYFAAQPIKQINQPKMIAQQPTKTPPEQVERQLDATKVEVKPLTIKSISLPAPPPIPPIETPIDTPKITESVDKSRAKPEFKTQAKPKMAAKPAITSKAATKVVDVSKHQSKTSEHLLQQVEAGKGPSIEINWPADAYQRQALFSTLVDCLGVGLGVLVNGSVTLIHESGRQYSRLVRMVGGKMVAREARFHRQSGVNGIAVRLFPRNVDSQLLAGLASIASQPLSQYSQVQGVYVLNGGSLWVKNIYFDGTLSQGNILLARSACRR